jgi:glycosyltransferase involved in cell wall biosynthesis
VVALSGSFADHVSLIAKGTKCALIHAGADVDRFKQARPSRHEVRTRLKLEGRTVFVYSGGLGAWHDPELLGRLFAVIVRAFPGALLLVLTGYDRNRLASILSRAGLGAGDFAIHSVQPQDIPNYLAACDYGLVPATLGSDVGPMNVIAETMIGTKVAEYLAADLPIIVNSNVGGLKSLMDRHRIGICFNRKDLIGVVPGIQSIVANYEDYQKECQLVAERYFSLDQVVQSYHQLYSDVTKGQ